MREIQVRAFADKESSVPFMEQPHHEGQALGTPRMGHSSLEEAGWGCRAAQEEVAVWPLCWKDT